MNTYVTGASMAFEGIARRFVKRDVEKTTYLSVNILGLTPLDFSVNGSDQSVKTFLEREGFEVISSWAMGSSLEEIANAGRASVNLVVSAAGLGAAKALKEMFGTPYVVGTPIGAAYQNVLEQRLLESAKTCKMPEDGKGTVWPSSIPASDIAVIGEGITSLSLAQAIELEYSRGVKVLCATECEKALLREKDVLTPYEDDIIEALQGIKMVIADPLYRPICPKDVKFISLPAENFSGRIYRKDIPDLIARFEN